MKDPNQYYRTDLQKKQQKPPRIRHTWAWIYGISLTIYTVFTLLQVFVIPHDVVKLDENAYASIYRTDLTANSRQNSENGSSSSITYSPHGSHGGTEAESPDSSGASSTADGSGSSGTADSSGSSSSQNSAQSFSEDGSATLTKTDNGYIYSDPNMVITLTESYINNTMVYAADIQLSSVALLKAGLAEDSFGRNVTEATSAIASRVGAILAVNGDFYGFRDSGYVIRNGVMYRETKKDNDAEDLVLWPDGSMEIIREGDITAAELYEKGALQVYSFGPGLIQNGEITVTASSEVTQSKTSNPRTAIGMISPLHYVMVVSDGRTTESRGLSLLELANVMKDLGCIQAYNLDGGGSTTMYFNGEVINNPTTGGSRTKERSVSDIVYIGY